jgi:hypothetical protein
MSPLVSGGCPAPQFKKSSPLKLLEDGMGALGWMDGAVLVPAGGCLVLDGSRGSGPTPRLLFGPFMGRARRLRFMDTGVTTGPGPVVTCGLEPDGGAACAAAAGMSSVMIKVAVRLPRASRRPRRCEVHACTVCPFPLPCRE